MRWLLCAARYSRVLEEAPAMHMQIEDLDDVIRRFDLWFSILGFRADEDRVDALDEIAAHCRQRVETEG